MNPHRVIHRLTVEQAATMAHRHPVTLYRALEAGDLHGTQRVPRGRWLIRPECLDAYLDNTECPHQVEEHARSA